jgi:hypothetical protein
MESKAKIILTRSSEWMNRARGYRVFIDGIEKGKIKNGISEEFVLEPGQHFIQCKIDWCSSHVFSLDLKPDEISYIRVKSGMKYYWPLLILLFVGLMLNLYFSVSLIKPKPSWASYLQIACVFPCLIYIIYNLSFGSKEYLLLEEDVENVFAA